MFVRLSFGSYDAVIYNAVTFYAISFYAVGGEAILYHRAVSERIYGVSILGLVTARSERDSCESHEHEN